MAAEWIEMLDLEVSEVFPVSDALETAPLCPKELRLSLGDRVGLSVAKATGRIAVTTDEQWKIVAETHPELRLEVLHLRLDVAQL